MRNYATKPERVCEVSLRFQLPNTIPTHFHSFKTITKCPFYSPSSYHLLKINFFSSSRRLWEQIFSRFELKLRPRKDRTPNDLSPPFKEKEKGGESRSKVWWPMECSNAWWPMECSNAWWPMDCSKLGGLWKVKEKHLFTSSHFLPNKFYLNFQFFPLTLRLYFTMVLGHYSRISFLFLDL